MLRRLLRIASRRKAPAETEGLAEPNQSATARSSRPLDVAVLEDRLLFSAGPIDVSALADAAGADGLDADAPDSLDAGIDAIDRALFGGADGGPDEMAAPVDGTESLALDTTGEFMLGTGDSPLPADLDAYNAAATDEVAAIDEVDFGSQQDTRILQIPEVSLPDNDFLAGRELVFVDAAVADVQQLVDDALSGADGRIQRDVIVLDADRDGIEQISEVLSQHQDITAVHIVSHGKDGAVKLGNTWLSADNLDGYAGDIAGWENALDSDADILLYGCDLAGNEDGQTLTAALSELTSADVAASTDQTGHADLDGDWDLEFTTGPIEAGIVFSSDVQHTWHAVLAPTSSGIAVWAENGTNAAEYSQWDGLSFGSEGTTANLLDEYRIIQGAEAPTRDEAIVVGVVGGSTIRGQMWNGSSWSVLPINDLGTGSDDSSWGFDVAYESVSGDALLVWNDKPNLEFSVWNGSSWTAPAVVTAYTGADPKQMQIAASPDSDEMVLIISDKDKNDWALVWDGSSWGNQIALTGVDSQNVTDVSVTYEQLSGDAMVVYAKDQTDVHYRLWDGSSWSAEGKITAPSGPENKARWTTLASDPNSDRIVLGVITEAKDAYFAVWGGAAWSSADTVSATLELNDRNYPNIAVAFENDNGEALAVYGEDDTTLRYRTWTPGGGWSTELLGPNLGEKPTSMTLDTDPATNAIMLSVLDEGKDVNYVAWDGDSWGSLSEQEVDTGRSDRQPFLFLFDVDNSGEQQAPTLELPGDALEYSLEYALGSPAMIIDPTASVSDPDSANFDTGTLTVDFTAGSTANDRLSIRDVGAGAGEIGVSGSTVTYGGVAIGTFTGGTDGSTPLVVTFNADATPETVDAVAKHITYENVSGSPSTDNRSVRFVVTDGDGGTSGAEVATVKISLSSTGAVAVWREKDSTTPEYNLFDGIDFGTEGNSGNLGQWRVIQGADSPTRDETIVLGIEDGSKTVTGQIWDGSVWTPLSINDLGTAKSDDYWSVDVAYEHDSGDAVIVWDDGGTLNYSVWNGTTWTAKAAVAAYTGGEPRQLQLAASPDSDEMVLGVVDKDKTDYALVWNGASWGNAITLTTTDSQDLTDISVAYEQESGHAMVVYAKDQTDVHYRLWNGSSWSGEARITAPSGPSGKARWTMLAADPNSDQIALGVLTEDKDAYFAVWNGSAWSPADKISATLNANDRNYPNIAVAFESQSGQALATYNSDDTLIRYRTWTTGGGWSSERTGPDLGEKPTSMTLDSDPRADRIMLSVLDEGKDVNYVLWDGSAWGTPAEQEIETGQSNAQPFVFLWNQDFNDAPVLSDTSVTLNSLAEDAGPPVGAVGTRVMDIVDLNPPAGGQDNVTDTDSGAVTGIAVTAADTANGTWHYSTNGGFSWNPLGAVSDGSARLLAADPNTRIYFQPDADYNGTLASALSFRAWDRTDNNPNGAPGVDVSTGGGNTAYSAATDTASLTVTPVNDAPVVAGLAGDGLAYDEGAGALLIDEGSNALASDVDSADFDTGNLTMSIAAGGDPTEDVLSVRDEGTLAGQIGFDGLNVTYGGALIGTAGGGSGGTNLIVTFNNAATSAAVSALTQNITYENTDLVSATAGPRTVRFTVSDGDGGMSADYDTTVNVFAGNDAPTISGVVGDSLSYDEGDGQQVIEQGDDAVVADADSPDFDGGNLTASIVAGGDAAEDVLSVDNQGMAGGQIGFDGSNVYYGGAPIGTATGGSGGTDLIVTLNANATPTAVTALVKNITYENTNLDDPSSGTRTVRFNVSDGDGATSSNHDATVSVNPLNAPPTTANLAGDALAYNEDDGAVLIEQGGDALVSDADSTDFDTGNLTVSIAAGGDAAEDVLSIRHEGMLGGQIGFDGSTVYYDGVALGTAAGGFGGTDLVVTLNSNATPPAVVALIKNISYENTDTDNPTDGARTVRFTVNDGDGGTSGNYDTTVTVSRVNDAPVNIVPPVQSTNLDTPVVFSVSGANRIAISDVEIGGGTAQVTLTATDGTMTLNGIAGLAFTSGSGTNDASMTFTGTVADINNALNGLSFAPTSGFAGGATLTLLTSDLGSAGAGGTQTDADSVTINVGESRSLWLSTDGNVSGSDVTGLDEWDSGEALQFGDPDLAFEPGTTDGTVSSILDLGRFTGGGSDGGMDALHYVNQDITVGGVDGTFDLQIGDVLLSIKKDGKTYTSTNSITVDKDEIFVFRPDSPGDYTSGTFHLLLDDFKDIHGGGNTWGISLVEQDTWVGDTTLSAGTFLFIQEGGSEENDIRVFTATGVGPGSTTGSVDTLIEGDDIGLSEKIYGVELIERETTIANATLQEGQILLTLEKDDISVGNNGISVTRHDVFYLDVTQTTLVSGTSQADATLLLEGGDVNFDDGNENLDALSLVLDNEPPTIGLPGGALNYTENNPATVIDPAATVTDGDSADFDTGALTVDFLAGGTANDRLAIQNVGTGAGEVGISGSNVTYEGTVIGTFSGGTDGSTPLVITFDADADQTAVQAVVQNVTYENVSEDPSGAARTVRFTLTDGDGGTSNSVTETINVTPVNDPPVLDLDANNSSGQSGADFATTFIEDGGPVSIADTDAVLSDVDNTTLTSLIVTITNQQDGNKELLAADTTGTSITANYVWATGTLTLSGTDSVANYRQVLRTITYENTSQNPDTTARVITFVAHDGTDLSNTGTTTVTMVAGNDAPVLDLDADDSSGQPGADFAATFTEDGGPVLAADDDATLSDDDNTNLQSLTVQITNLLDGAAENLAANTSGTAITASYDSGTGRLTLSGNDSVANYQQVLRTVAYDNSSQDPNTTDRVLQVVANDGIADSNLGTTTIDIVAQNDAPIESTIESSPLAYTENDGPATITSTLTLSDVDDTNIESATVRISGNFTPSEDVLAFVNTANITATWDALSGTLTLIGSDTLANYEAALQSVTYENTSDDPNAASRTVRFTVHDGDANSNTLVRDIDITPVNDAPVEAAIEAAPLAYTENDGPVAITSSITISDLDDTHIESATVRISSNFTPADDVLAFANTANITSSWDPATGTLTLTGSDTLANYEAALRSVTYENTSENPNTATRTVNFTVNDGDADSNLLARDIAITPVNDAPVEAAIEPVPLAYTENDGPQTVTSTISISDLDDTNIESATIRISGNFTPGEDVLAFTNTPGITGSWDPITGILTLTGSDTLANYEAALQSVTYENTSENPSTATRSVNFTVHDGNAQSNTLTRDINITSVNDAPVHTVPGAQTTDEDISLTFSTAGGNRIAVSDVDAGGAPVSVTLAATNGTLTLSGVGGLTFITGDGTDDALINLTGTITDINAALDGMAFTPNADYNGPGGVQIVTGDQGFTGVGGELFDTDTVDITVDAVNDAPTGTVPGPQITAEDTPLVFSSADGNRLSISDIDAGNNPVIATLSVTNGTLTLGSTAGLTFGNGDGADDTSMTFAGTVDDINAALEGTAFASAENYHGGATLQITVDDQGSVGSGGAKVDQDTVDITVTSVNDAPVASAEAYEVDNDKVLAVSAPGLLTDAIDVDGDPLSVQLVSGPTGGRLVLLPNGALRYEPRISFSGSDTFTYVVNDGQAKSEITTVTITVNAAVGPSDGNNDPPPDDPPDDPGDDGEDPLPEVGGLPPTDDPRDDPHDNRDPRTTHDPRDTSGETPTQDLNPLVISLDYEGIQSVGYHAARNAPSVIAKVVETVAPLPIRVSAEQLLATLGANALWENLDQLQEELSSQAELGTFAVGTAAAATAVLSVGYVAWALRGSYLLASVLSTLPAWRLMDPLPVLAAFDDEEKEDPDRQHEDDEMLETMMGSESDQARDPHRRGPGA